MLIIKTLENTFDFLNSTPVVNQGKILCPTVDNVHQIHSHAQTISEFMRENSQDKLTPEWEIILDLSNAVFKKHFPNKPKEYFFSAMDLFKDLRSFTTKIDLLSECLEEFDHTTKNIVTLFWQYIEEKGIIDEDECYKRVTEKFCDEDTRCDKETVTFIGFQHMTAHQIDLIKALSKKHNVYVLLNQYQCDNAQDTDWINWFDVKKREKSNQPKKKYQVKTLTYPKNRLAEFIHHFLHGHKKTHIVLAQKNLNFNHCNEIAVPGTSFKYREDIFTPIIDEIFEEMTLKTSLQGSFLKPSFIEEFLDKELTKELLKKGEKHFRRIKTLSFLKDLLNKWKSVSEMNSNITDLDIAIFRHVALIRLPKTYAQKFVEEPNAFIFGIDKIPIKTDAELNIFVASSHYNAFEQDFYRYNAKAMNILSAIGPIRRRGFEVLFFKKQIINFFKRDKVILFMETGLLEENPFWGELKQDIEFTSISFQKTKREKAKDYLGLQKKKHDTSTSYSAKKLQTYMDCPRKFYYSYVEKLSPRFHVSNALFKEQLGILEHKAIKEFLDGTDSLDTAVKRVFKNYLCKESINLSQSNERLYFQEIQQNVEKGVSFVQKLKEFFEISQCYLELPVDDGPFKGGRADFVADSPRGKILIDFKRSKAPIQKDILDQREIQIHYYLSHLKIEIENTALIGFYCLSKPEDSYLISKDSEMNFGEGIKINKFDEKMENAFRSYPDYERDLVEKIQNERDFRPLPRKEDICRYCNLKDICPRGTLQ